jgi:hypothetical protein
VCRVLTLEKQEKSILNCDISTTQSLFLYSICLLMRGSKECFMQFHSQRSFLITMCRPFIAAHGSAFKSTKHESHRSSDIHASDWEAWIKDESIRRMIYAVWSRAPPPSQYPKSFLLINIDIIVLDCYNLVLHDVPVSLSMSELSINLPSPDRLWDSPNFQSWVDERNKGGK